MKKLLLLSVALITAQSVVNASDVQGTQSAPEVAAAVKDSNMLQRLAQAWDVTRNFVTGHAKNASEYVQPRFESAKAWANGLELEAKATAVKQSLFDVSNRTINDVQLGYTTSTQYVAQTEAFKYAQAGYAISTQYVEQTEAFKYAQDKYVSVINSDIAQKISDYGNQGIELVQENPKTAVALATAAVLTAWIIKKCCEKPVDPKPIERSTVWLSLDKRDLMQVLSKQK